MDERDIERIVWKAMRQAAENLASRKRQPDWRDAFNEVEQKLIATCRTFAAHPCALPGKNLMVLIAKMADRLDSRED